MMVFLSKIPTIFTFNFTANDGETILRQNKQRYMWKYYALLSAVFAALTAIFAKIGVKDVNSDLATAIRTNQSVSLRLRSARPDVAGRKQAMISFHLLSGNFLPTLPQGLLSHALPHSSAPAFGFIFSYTILRYAQ